MTSLPVRLDQLNQALNPSVALAGTPQIDPDHPDLQSPAALRQPPRLSPAVAAAVRAGDVGPVLIHRLFGIPVYAVTMAQVERICRHTVQARGRLNIGVINAAKVVSMRRVPLLRDAVLSSDLVLADGMSVVWASRLLGTPLPERVTGIDLFERLLGVADACGLAVYFLGATPMVLSALVARVSREKPGVKIAGARDGYFSDAQAAEVAAAIRTARPDFLFVGMSSPRKETFLARWFTTLDVPVCHGVGGSFDVLAGQVRRAPETWQRLGLEWLYRVAQEPRRLWKRYLVTNTIFTGLVAAEWARKQFSADE